MNSETPVNKACLKASQMSIESLINANDHENVKKFQKGTFVTKLIKKGWAFNKK